MTMNSTAEMHIQWIELVYNTTDSTPAPPPMPQMCANICSIDQTSKTGTPVLVQEPQSTKNPDPISLSLHKDFSSLVCYYIYI